MMAKTKAKTDLKALVETYNKDFPNETASAIQKKMEADGHKISYPTANTYIKKLRGDGGTSKAAGKDLEKAALKFAFLSVGSIDKALKAVEGYAEDDLASFISECGGPKKALEQLQKLKDQAK
jgi:hypothetical protein